MRAGRQVAILGSLSDQTRHSGQTALPDERCSRFDEAGRVRGKSSEEVEAPSIHIQPKNRSSHAKLGAMIPCPCYFCERLNREGLLSSHFICAWADTWSQFFFHCFASLDILLAIIISSKCSLSLYVSVSPFSGPVRIPLVFPRKWTGPGRPCSCYRRDLVRARWHRAAYVARSRPAVPERSNAIHCGEAGPRLPGGARHHRHCLAPVYGPKPFDAGADRVYAAAVPAPGDAAEGAGSN